MARCWRASRREIHAISSENKWRGPETHSTGRSPVSSSAKTAVPAPPWSLDSQLDTLPSGRISASRPGREGWTPTVAMVTRAMLPPPWSGFPGRDVAQQGGSEHLSEPQTRVGNHRQGTRDADRQEPSEPRPTDHVTA